MKRIFREPLLILTIFVVIAALVLFVLYPILRVFTFPAISDYAAVLKTDRYFHAALNSLLMVLLSASTATLFGFLFAFGLTKTTIPLKRLLKGILILPLFSPPFMVAFSYLMMFGRNGLITYGLFGVRTNILGWHGLWLSETIAFFPVAALTMEGVLESIAPSLEYAGRNLGATGFKLFRTVTLPLATPGVAGAALLVSILVLADFGNPIMISGDFSVLATEAWLRVEGWGDVAGAAVLSSLLLVPSVIIFAIQRFWVGRRSYVTITGKIANMQPEPTKWYVRWPLFTFCVAVSIMILLVYVALILGAFVKGWGFDWAPTLRWISSVVADIGQLVRSLVFSVVAGVTSALFAMTAAYLVTRKRFPLRGVVDFVAILPAALPGIFLGIGYSISFTRPPVDLYGTAAIIILSMIFWNISMGYQTGLGALRQISPSLGEAASNLGAGSMRIFREIEVPLLQGPFFSAFVVSFIRSITTLSVIVFLATSKNSVVTFTIMNFVSDGFYGKAAALTSLLLLISFAVLGIAKLLVGKKL
ncbi:MAG TPA: iron ABC transporter permease, partial [Spirochaetia bacterium]|nr:iron ABC transporter permease [Spirochaetia bacterium]